MKKRSIVLLAALTILFLIGSFFSPLARAQEEGGFKETFDDSTLPGWEHSPGATVGDGVLKVEPGNFALRFGDWSDITMSIKVRFSGEEALFVNYYFRDEGKYGVLFREGAIVLEKVQQRSPTELGSISVSDVQQNTWIKLKVIVSGGQHQIYVNDELQLTVTDQNPLETGAIMLEAMGEATAEFDDLEVMGKGFAHPPEEGPHPGDELPPGEGSPPGGAPEMPAAIPGAGVDESADGILQEFFASQANEQELTTFMINLILAAICSYILGLVYIHWGASLTNRRKFAANFVLMTITTTFIILVVRSSVALSLGLVGALSIVRFRTAVKEPEELAYLFFAIGLGIGLGDNQRLITLLVLLVGVVIIGLTKLLRQSQADVNLHLTVASHGLNKIEPEQIMDALRAHTSKLKLLRLDERSDTLETAFLVELKKVSDLNDARAALKALSESVEITFLDNKGIW